MIEMTLREMALRPHPTCAGGLTMSAVGMILADSLAELLYGSHRIWEPWGDQPEVSAEHFMRHLERINS